ncbi:putative MFS monocarboxylate transporter [Lineolata rhizophorae]|uniref:Putative MFS monocarboxylate transporter n=1 Tax=Lineolata rhizophorae TaxID=578093 RepID=A0A6A6P9I1_9PEZI|nr:putative MFS monocarboxylate transporter [Lineolata rhizophorae]
MAASEESTLELAAFNGDDGDEETHHGPEFALPPADRGKDAWMFLCACFIVEAMVWGFPFSFGVFQTYYSTHEPFSSEPSGIAAVGTTSTGILYFSAPLALAIAQAWPRVRRPSAAAGLILTIIGLIGASFANTVPHLIATQGVIYAVGGTVLYFPMFIYLDEWFIQRKGLAFGIMWAGTGASGATIPLVMEAALSRWGFRTTLRAWSVAMFLLTTPALFYLRGRLPVQHQYTGFRNLDLTCLRTGTFWIFQTGNIFESLGFFMPSIYLPSYSTSIGLSHLTSTLSLSTYNLATVAGFILFGALTDRYDVTTVILMSTLGATFSILLLWGLSSSSALVYLFAVAYGVTAGGYSTFGQGCVPLIRRACGRTADTGMVVALLAAGRGIGSITSGPISEALIGEGAGLGKAIGAYGTSYGILVIWSGVTAALGGLAWVARVVGMV